MQRRSGNWRMPELQERWLRELRVLEGEFNSRVNDWSILDVRSLGHLQQLSNDSQ